MSYFEIYLLIGVVWLLFIQTIFNVLWPLFRGRIDLPKALKIEVDNKRRSFNRNAIITAIVYIILWPWPMYYFFQGAKE